MKSHPIAVRISTIRQAAGNAPGRIGNLIINQRGPQAQPENWFSSREFRNQLLGQKLNPELPLFYFAGITIRATQIEIEPADLKDGKFEVQGTGKDPLTGKPRMITYTKAGIHNINMELDLSSMDMDRLMAISDLSLKHARQTRTLAQPVQAPAEVMKPEDAPEGPDGTDNNEPVNPVVHENLHAVEDNG